MAKVTKTARELDDEILAKTEPIQEPPNPFAPDLPLIVVERVPGNTWGEMMAAEVSILPGRGELDQVNQIRQMVALTATKFGAKILDKVHDFHTLGLSGEFVKLSLSLRQKYFCHCLALSPDPEVAVRTCGFDFAKGFEQVMIEQLLDNENVIEFSAIVLSRILDDEFLTPEVIRTRILSVQEALQRGLITAAVARESVNALKLLAQTKGMLVVEADKEQKSGMMEFHAGPARGA